MKIRKGFVSNSSSSSYICDVCGEAKSGWDIGLDELDMVECKNGHIFHDSECVNPRGVADWDDICSQVAREGEGLTDDDEIDEYISELRYEFPIDYCPICQLKIIPNLHMLNYLLVKEGIKRSDLEEEINKRFKTYDELVKFAFPKD